MRSYLVCEGIDTRTNNDTTAIMTIPTLWVIHICQRLRVRGYDKSSYLQLRWPSETLERVCPPRIPLRIQNPHIPTRLKMHGIITPKYLWRFDKLYLNWGDATDPKLYRAWHICRSPSLGPHVDLYIINISYHKQCVVVSKQGRDVQICRHCAA